MCPFVVIVTHVCEFSTTSGLRKESTCMSRLGAAGMQLRRMLLIVALGGDLSALEPPIFLIISALGLVTDFYEVPIIIVIITAITSLRDAKIRLLRSKARGHTHRIRFRHDSFLK